MSEGPPAQPPADSVAQPKLDGQAAALDATPSVVPIVAPAPSAPSPGQRRRHRTLRIPDDEVARPRSADGESAPPPSVSAPSLPAATPAAAPAMPADLEPLVPMVPTRIITISQPEVGAPPPPAEVRAQPPAPTPQRLQGGRTPLLPTGADDVLPHERVAVVPQHLPSDDLIPIHDEAPSEEPSSDEGPPTSPESAPESLEPEDLQLVPPSPKPLQPPRAVVQTEHEAEEIRIEAAEEEDDVPTPVPPLPTPRPEPPPDAEDRKSEPGAEISPDDLLAVEASPRLKPASLPPVRTRVPSQPPALKTTQPPSVKTPLVIVPPHVGTMGPQVAEGSGLRRKGRLWWEELFNDDYLRACEKLTDEQISREVDFIEDSLGVERGGAVLDLACGTGRHAIELARRAYEVVGFDLSLAMLARAGDEAQDRDAQLNFVQGDMREMTFEEQFDGVFCWNTSFGYFDEDKNAQVIDRIHHALKGGGLFLLDVVNRDFLIRQSPSLAWFEGEGCVCMDEMCVDFITSRMKIKRTMMFDDGRSREIEYSMRIYSLHELGRILHEHNFKVCEVSGRLATPGVFFGNESPRTLILAEKK